MPVAITVRNVPESVRDELAARAAGAGQSLQEYLLSQMVDVTSRPSMEQAIRRARERVDLTGTVVGAKAIVAERDAGRR